MILLAELRPIRRARPGSGFTLLFEALAMTLMTAMPVAAAAHLMGEHDTRMWRVLHHWVEQARERADYSEVRRVAIDETAAKRGHDYMSLAWNAWKMRGEINSPTGTMR